MPLLLVLACCCFVSSLTVRIVDPMVPTIAADFATPEATISLLATAFAIPYALIQLVLGPLGDQVGKPRVIIVCMVLLTLASATAAVATSLEVLFAARVLGGLAGGGIIPLAIALVGDLVPFEERQMALSKILTALVGGLLAGTIATGFLAAAVGWRGVFITATALGAIFTLIAWRTLRGTARAPRPDATSGAISAALKGYARILANPRAYVCFSAVFVEGLLILGLLPFVATLLARRGAGGLEEAGAVLAGVAVGGLIYTQSAGRLLAWLGGAANLIRLGAVTVLLGFGGVALQGSWPLEMAAFVLLGFSFYAIHNSLQTESTELAPTNRGAAVSLYGVFFYGGQAIGPLFYAAAFLALPPSPVIAAVGVVVFVLALLLAAALSRRVPINN